MVCHSRYVSWQPVDGSDLMAVVGLEADEALAGYLRVRKETLPTTWWNTAWLVVATVLTASFYVLPRRKKHQLEGVRATYRLATEDAGDGFFINRPVRGSHGQVEDFLIVDCNQHLRTPRSSDAGHPRGAPAAVLSTQQGTRIPPRSGAARMHRMRYFKP